MKKLLKSLIIVDNLSISIFVYFLFSISLFSQHDTLNSNKDTIKLVLNDSLVEYDSMALLDSSDQPRAINIIAVGDLMIGSHFPDKSYLPSGENCPSLPIEVRKILRSADVTFGNLEGCFLNDGEVAKKCSDLSRCYAFKMPEEYAYCFFDAGFDLLSMANNHSGDFGYKGRKRSMELLDSFGIGYSGLTNTPYTIMNLDTLLIGMAAFSPNKGTTSIHDYSNLKKIVRFLDDTCDIVIVSFHGGAEGAKYEHVPRKNEIFYGEDRGDVYKFAHSAIDNGADVVFGHGPHVTRSVEFYKEKFIIYSMGNFATYGRFNLSGPNGIAPIVNIYVDKNGKFLKGNIIPIKQIDRGIPIVDENSTVIKKLQYLQKEDFPESTFIIEDDGKIKLK